MEPLSLCLLALTLALNGVLASRDGAATAPIAKVEPVFAPVPRVDALGGVRRALKEFEIEDGPFRGAIRATPRGGLNWYFANQALIQLVDQVPDVAKAHLDAYLRNLGDYGGAKSIVPDYTDHTHVWPVHPDSHDAYAGSVLELAAAYVRVSRDDAWFEDNREKLVQIARHNIVDQIRSEPVAGLVRVYQKGSTHLTTARPLRETGYLMDNCEAYAGLRDLSALLLAKGHREEGDAFAAAAARIAKGIDALYSAETGAYRWADESPPRPGDAWYPDLMCQVFPDLFGVPVTDAEARAKAAWAYVQTLQPEWYTINDEDHPQLILGYYSLLRRQDPHMAAWSLENWLGRPQKPGMPFSFSNVADLGWASAIQRLLNQGR
ncbi:MAG: hypothetical protein KIS66_06830 [Fimbriimonadaceae bacterium]|nr:hypothetical protein [Fimbriimonadaceae bacterium]